MRFVPILRSSVAPLPFLKTSCDILWIRALKSCPLVNHSMPSSNPFLRARVLLKKDSLYESFAAVCLPLQPMAVVDWSHVFRIYLPCFSGPNHPCLVSSQ